MSSIRLGSRLAAVARAVRPGSVTADIGTDHAYLLCHLVREGIVPRGYACDIGEGPLARARATVRACGLRDRIELRLADGLRGLPLAEIGDIVIAGMGGELIARILAECPACMDPGKRFVLQPMTRADELRRFLRRAGFALQREEAVLEGRRVYTVMTAAYTGERGEADELFAFAGLHAAGDSPQSRAYLDKVARALEKKARGLGKSAEYEAQAGAWMALASEIRKLKREE